MPRRLSLEEVQARQDRLATNYGPETTLHDDMKRKYHVPAGIKQTFYYVFGFTREGKKVFLGPFTTTPEADTELSKLDDGEIFDSPSRSLAKATREIKAELMSRGEEADSAIERMKHQVPEPERKKSLLRGR